MVNRRGIFCVFEGGDRCGKTSQIGYLMESLTAASGPDSVKILKFPNRESKSGVIIDQYLKEISGGLNDQAIHLLFSANRWECADEIMELLNQGITLLVDRYSYSGIAYSSAKGLDLDWCTTCDKGLPTPDLVFYLDLAPERAATRGDYGAERYEKVEFQQKVKSKFLELFQKQDNCIVVDADQEKSIVATHILSEYQKYVQNVDLSLPVKRNLWC